MSLDQRRQVAPRAAWMGQILAAAAARTPDHTALVCGTVRLTYAELAARAAAVAHGLRQRGVEAGDVVSLYAQNRWEWIVAYHGVLQAGATVNPVNVMLTESELRYVLEDGGSVAVLAGGHQTAVALAAARGLPNLRFVCSFDRESEAVDFADLLDTPGVSAVATVADLGAVASVGYTSGTTGHPKGALQSHRSLILNVIHTATMHGRRADDVMVTALPAAHVYGNIAINSIFHVGGTVVLMERFDPAEALRLIQAEGATLFEGVPAMYARMLTDPSLDHTDLTALDRCTVGGQTYAPELQERWEARSGVPLLDLWGMTELSGLGTTHPWSASGRPGSCGMALPGMQFSVRRIEDSSEPVETGERGELVVKGPLVTLGYYNRPQATEAAFTTDGWFRTGDVARIDAEGYVYIVDRLKDMILTGGYNVYPAEIERAISQHPDVELVAVGRTPDEVLGEKAIAYVVARAGATLSKDDIDELCREALAAYKRPRDVVFVDQLPTTSSGKLMRRALGKATPS